MIYNEKLTIEEIPLGHPGLKNFAKFPWRLYRGDPCWTPPLNGDLLGSRLLGLKGLLSSAHPYHCHAVVTHFIARYGKRPAGRISAAVNRQYNDYHHARIGFFGFFEVIDDFKAAQALLDSAKNWVKAQGMTVLRGPGEYSNSTHERQGILIDGFQHPPTVELTHNPPYYGQFLERYGFQKAKDYVAYIAEKDSANIALISRLARKVSKNMEIETRAISLKKMKAEVRLILNIYNKAWAQNWGFLPISGEEGDALADTLRFIIDPGLVRFAFLNGEPAAVMGIIPDPNYALRPRWRWYGDSDMVRLARLLVMRRRIPATRGMFFGIKPEFRKLGIPVVLANEIADYLMTRHYKTFDGSLILEDNEEIIKIIEVFGGKYYKRWRIYDLPLK
jgi:GNAT superfamily N-acetyltransferase